MTGQISAEIYSPQLDLLGEGPLWSRADQALYWLDIARKVLYRLATSDTTTRSWALDDYPGCIAEALPDTIAIAMGAGVHRLDLRSGASSLLCAAPCRPAGTRFNDGKLDPLGRFWAGTMQNNFGPNGDLVSVERTDGALYRFDLDGSARTVEEDMGIANTLAWSPDLKRFYFADSLRGQIYVYDFDADSGAVRNKRVLYEGSGYGVPDGSAIDVDGCLWNARWDAGVILRITPTGDVDREISLPVPRPTSCIFGGPGFNTLYVTSARVGLSAAQLKRFPQSGSVFAIAGIAQGMPVPPFACDLPHEPSAAEIPT